MARPSRIVFVDAIGGSLAALGAAFAALHGVRDSVASTTVAEPHVEPEVTRALGEVGLPTPPVERWAESMGSGGALLVGLGHGIDQVPAAKRLEAALHSGPVVDPSLAPAVVGSGLEGLPIERLAAARIARDHIERALEAMLAG